jgi:hypothetical protein
MAVMITTWCLARWVTWLDALVGVIAGWFGRVEPQARMGGYLRGLLSAVERKNGSSPPNSWATSASRLPAPTPRLGNCTGWARNRRSPGHRGVGVSS